MEPFDIRLDGEEIEASPNFDNLPAEPPNKKIRRLKSTTKKERDYLLSKFKVYPWMISHHFAWTRLEPSWYNILTLNTEVFAER